MVCEEVRLLLKGWTKRVRIYIEFHLGHHSCHFFAFFSDLLAFFSKNLLKCISLGVDCDFGCRSRNLGRLGTDGNSTSWHYSSVVKQKMAVNSVLKFKVRVFL